MHSTATLHVVMETLLILNQPSHSCCIRQANQEQGRANGSDELNCCFASCLISHLKIYFHHLIYASTKRLYLLGIQCVLIQRLSCPIFSASLLNIFHFSLNFQKTLQQTSPRLLKVFNFWIEELTVSKTVQSRLYQGPNSTSAGGIAHLNHFK